MSEKELVAYSTAVLGVLYGLLELWRRLRSTKRANAAEDARASLEQKSDQADATRSDREKDFVTSRLEKYADRLQRELVEVYKRLADREARATVLEKENETLRWKLTLKERLDEDSAGGGKPDDHPDDQASPGDDAGL